MVETVLMVSSIMMVISFILILIALFFLYKTFKLMLKSLSIQEGYIHNIKYKLERLEYDLRQSESKGKHQKLFEGEK